MTAKVCPNCGKLVRFKWIIGFLHICTEAVS